MSSVIKSNSPDVASSRGISRIRCSSYDYPKIFSLIDGMAAVYELDQDNDGNYSAKYWEWKERPSLIALLVLFLTTNIDRIHFVNKKIVQMHT
ncbi:MAG: hypothetical protein M3146_01350 [Thermoproteota archaeon]|nr:hypothetical protein [Thermoproteota archaeon]